MLISSSFLYLSHGNAWPFGIAAAAATAGKNAAIWPVCGHQMNKASCRPAFSVGQSMQMRSVAP